ncbi:MAG: hypothetical protein M3322_04370 [Actinomycetota bacterium]|nr:hypothetical protein [Actinomycetota bacterium]
MRRRRAVAALALAAAGGFVVMRRLTRSGVEERVDLYFGDGSMVSLDGDSADAQRLLPIARDLLSTIAP